jgi:hypothetical protein
MIKRIAGICCLALLFSCSKDDDPVAAGPANYLTTSTNSTWNYAVYDSLTSTTSQYTVTSTNRDTTVNNRVFHVYTSTAGGNIYYNKTDLQYFSFEKAPAPINNGNRITYLYLINEAEGFTWSQTHQVILNPPTQLLATFNNEIVDKGISKTVNNVVYNNVVHVRTVITTTGLAAGSFSGVVNTYFAPQVGIIQKESRVLWNGLTGIAGENKVTRLMSATIL